MHIRTWLSVALLLTSLSAAAQGQREQIELLVMEGNSAIFSSEGYASTKKDAVEQAQMAVLRRLLYDGVEGYNWGNPIVVSGQGTNLWLNEFFTGKYPAYKNFISQVELVGDFHETPTGETHCYANVVVKCEQLLQQARSQGVTSAPATVPQQQQPTPTPTQKKPKRSFL